MVIILFLRRPFGRRHRCGDLVTSELQGILGSCLVCPSRRETAAGDVDLNGNLQSQPGKGPLLPAQFRLGGGHLAPGDVGLSAVGHRVDLRQYLALLDVVVVLDREADEVPRHRLRRDVDDVGLHKSVFGDRVCPPVGPPGVDKDER